MGREKVERVGIIEVEAESIRSTPVSSHQIISRHQTERGREKQRERERELVASGRLCSQINIRLMSL